MWWTNNCVLFPLQRPAVRENIPINFRGATFLKHPVHTKLPILAAYPYRSAGYRNIAVRYGYAASIGSLVWALTKKHKPIKR